MFNKISKINNQEENNITYYKLPMCLIKLITNKDSLLQIKFVDSSSTNKEYLLKQEYSFYAKKVISQLDEYFDCKRKNFELNLNYQGTVFQNKVWYELLKIPFGNIVSYKDIAYNIKNPLAVRAVGNANNKNPLPIMIPCHRVIATNGNLTGYAGGLTMKKWLISHEKKFTK